jgi:outer membrane protein
MSRFSHIRALGGVALLTLGLCVAPRAAAPEGAVPLSLEDALKTALQNNFDIKVEQVTLQEADQSLKGSYGIYDTQLNFTWYNNVNRVPATSRLDVGDITATYMNRTDAYNLGITQPTSWGQSFQLVWNNNRDLTNSLYSYLNPTYNSNATLGTTLPLLQGFGKTVASRTVLLAKLSKEIAGSAYLQNVRDALIQVEKDYFQLVYDVKDLETREAALDLAKRFQEETRKRIEVGVLAPIEQVTADAQVATREQDIITARQAVDNSMDILRLDLGVPKDSDEWNRPIQPTDEPKLISNEKTEAELVDQALARRPEVAQLKGKLEQDKINLAVAKNASLPQLNLTASVTYNGASGTYTDPVTGQVLYDHAFSKAWSQITGTDFKSYYVGLAFSYPIQNRAAKAQVQNSLLAKTADEIGMEKLKLSIGNEVRAGLRDLEAAKKRVNAAEVTFRLQKEKLEAEQKKYDNGLSTAFNVLSYQNDLLAAATSLLNARVYTQVAGAKLERAIGTYLESRGIELK